MTIEKLKQLVANSNQKPIRVLFAGLNEDNVIAIRRLLQNKNIAHEPTSPKSFDELKDLVQKKEIELVFVSKTVQIQNFGTDKGAEIIPVFAGLKRENAFIVFYCSTNDYMGQKLLGEGSIDKSLEALDFLEFIEEISAK